MATFNGTGKGGKSFQDRELAARVRTLALREVEKALMLPDDDDFKRAVLLRLASTILPRLNEHTGKDGEELFPAPIYGGQSIPFSRHNSDTQDIPSTRTD